MLVAWASGHGARSYRRGAWVVVCVAFGGGRWASRRVIGECRIRGWARIVGRMAWRTGHGLCDLAVPAVLALAWLLVCLPGCLPPVIHPR